MIKNHPRTFICISMQDEADLIVVGGKEGSKGMRSDIGAIYRKHDVACSDSVR